MEVNINSGRRQTADVDAMDSQIKELKKSSSNNIFYVMSITWMRLDCFSNFFLIVATSKPMMQVF